MNIIMKSVYKKAQNAPELSANRKNKMKNQNSLIRLVTGFKCCKTEELSHRNRKGRREK